MEGTKGGMEMLTKEDLLAISELLNPLREDIARLDGKVEQLTSEMKDVKARLTKNEKDIMDLGTLVENETGRMVNLMVEGHESLRQTIKEDLTTKKQHEEVRTRVFALEEAVKAHTAQIEELQRMIG